MMDRYWSNYWTTPIEQINQIDSSPQNHVFGLEELLTRILEYTASQSTTKDLLGYRLVGKLWAKCAKKMFREPPLKLPLELQKFYFFKSFQNAESFIPLEVIVTNWLTMRDVALLMQFSANVEGLHFQGLEGVSNKVLDIMILPKLKILTIDMQYEVYYQTSRMSTFINNLVNRSPNLKQVKVIYDENITRYFQTPLREARFPSFMTHLKASNVSVNALDKLLKQSDLTNLCSVELDLKPCNLGVNGISRLLKQRFCNITLKTLKLHFQAQPDDWFLLHPMPHLENLETNGSIVIFDCITPLPALLPKLVTLTSNGGEFRNMRTFWSAKGYENLKTLTLHRSKTCGYRESEEVEKTWLSNMKAGWFPATPNLESLAWMGFSDDVTDIFIPRIFKGSKQLLHLDISIQDLERLFDHYLHDEFNSLGGTTFNRLKTLTIQSLIPQHCDKLLTTIAIIMIDLEKIILGKNVEVKEETKTAWEESGRKMDVDEETRRKMFMRRFHFHCN